MTQTHTELRQHIREIMDSIRQRGAIHADDMDDLLLLLEQDRTRLERALKLASDPRRLAGIKHIVPRMVVVEGSRGDHRLVVGSSYCSCQDFIMRVCLRDKSKICYHLLGTLLAEALGNLESKVFMDPFGAVNAILDGKNLDDSPHA